MTHEQITMLERKLIKELISDRIAEHAEHKQDEMFEACQAIETAFIELEEAEFDKLTIKRKMSMRGGETVYHEAIRLVASKTQIKNQAIAKYFTLID